MNRSQTERAKNVSQFGRVDEALAFPVVRLERLHEVGEGTGVRLAADCLVDR